MWRYRNGTEEAIYLYTADGERLWEFNLNGKNRWTLRDLDGKVLREYSYDRGTAVWTVDRDYVYRNGTLLAAQTPQGVRHFSVDHLGTPRLITNQFGNQVAYHAYYPFGEEATAFSQDSERMKFTGHERDLHSLAGAGDDLDYMHARYCSPMTGRFLSFDPVGGNIRNPQSWNRYTYAINNPLKWVDPDGLLPASQQGRNRLERLADSIAAFFSGLLHEWLDEDEDPADPETEADQPDDMAAQLEAEGIDSSALPSERGAAFKDAFIEGHAQVAGGIGAVAFTAAEEATIARVTGILRPGGRMIGTPGTGSHIRKLPGGKAAAETLFNALTKGGRDVTPRTYSGKMYEIARGARVGYRETSSSGLPTIDVHHMPGMARTVEIKFIP